MMIRLILSLMCLVAFASAHVKLSAGVKRLILKKHNGYRKATGGGQPNLQWNNTLAAFAESRINTCKYGHDPAHTYGENLYWTTDKKMKIWRAAKRACDAWASEIQYINLAPNWGCAYGKVPARKTCGHYTQEIWSGTTQIGCAVNRCSKGKRKTLVYCEYFPKGNIMIMKLDGTIVQTPPY